MNYMHYLYLPLFFSIFFFCAKLKKNGWPFNYCILYKENHNVKTIRKKYRYTNRLSNRW